MTTSNLAAHCREFPGRPFQRRNHRRPPPAPGDRAAGSGGDALQVIRDAGVGEVWSTDCVQHPSNAVSMATSIAEGFDRYAGASLTVGG